MSTIRGELVGGATAAILGIPTSIGYGVLALHALGDQYVSHAILAGLYGASLVPLAALALGYRGATIYAPRRPPSALLLGSVVLQTIAPAAASGGSAWSVEQTLTLLFLVILMAGVFQALFGALSVGTLIKYIPAPVMAGFQNAVALLILIAQLGTLTGAPPGLSPAEIGHYLSAVQPLTLAIGLGTAIVIWRVRRLSARVPPVFAGLVAGTGAIYALAFLGYGERLGRVVGPTPPVVPSTAYPAGFLALPNQPELWAVLPPSPARRSALLWSPRSTPCSARRRSTASPGGRRRAARSCSGSDSRTRWPPASGASWRGSTWEAAWPIIGRAAAGRSPPRSPP